MEVIRGWFQRVFADPQVVILAVLLVTGFVVILTMGRLLTPVLAALVLAYLLDGVVEALQQRGERLDKIIGLPDNGGKKTQLLYAFFRDYRRGQIF